MAKLPGAVFDQTISTNLGQAPSGRAGLEFEGLKDLAQGATKLGVGIAGLVEKRQRAKSDDFVNTMENQFLRDSLESKKNDYDFYKGTDFSGYAATRQNFIDEQRKIYLESAPDEITKQRVQLAFDKFANKSLIEDSSFENSQRVSFYTLNDEKNFNSTLNSLYANPDLSMASEYYDQQLGHYVNSEVYSDKQKEAKIEELHKVATTALDGMIANGGTGLGSAQDFIEGKTEHANLLNALPAKTKDFYKNKISKAIRTEQVRQVSEIKSNSFDKMLAIEAGDTSPSTVISLEQDIKKMTQLNETLKSPSLKNFTLRAVDFVTQAREIENSTKLKLSELTSRFSQIDSSKPSTPEQSREKIIAKKTLQKLINSFVSDGAAASIKENPNLKEGTQEIIDYQIWKGVPNPKLFSKQTERLKLSTLKRSPDRIEELKNFKDQAGRNLDLHIQWLKNQGKLDNEIAKYAAAIDTDNEFVQYYLLRSSKEIQKTNEAFKLRHPLIKESTIHDRLANNEEIDNYFDALGTEENLSGISAMKDAMVGYIKERMSSLESDENNVTRPILEETAKLFISDNFSFAKVKSPSGKDKIAIPARYRLGTDNIQDFLDDFSDISNLTEKEASVLGIDHTIIKDENGKNFYSSNEEFLKVLSENDGKMQLTPDGEHFMITYLNPGRGRFPVTKVIENADGSKSMVPLLFPLKDIVSPTNPYEVKEDRSLNILSFQGFF